MEGERWMGGFRTSFCLAVWSTDPSEVPGLQQRLLGVWKSEPADRRLSISFLLTDGPQYDALVRVPCIKNSAPELKDVIVLTLSFHTEAGREKNPPFVPLQHRLSLAKAA